MGAGTKLHGGDELREALKKALLKHPETKVRRALSKASAELIGEAKRLAGKAKKHQNTGVLVDSIRVLRRYNRDPLGVYVGPVYKRKRNKREVDSGGKPKGEFGNAWYAHFVEYGTDKHNLGYKGKFVTGKGADHEGAEPTPFMRPAYDTTRQSVIDRMMTELEKMILG